MDEIELPPRVSEFIDDLPPDGGVWHKTGLRAFRRIAAQLRATGERDCVVCELLKEAFDGAAVASKTA